MAVFIARMLRVIAAPLKHVPPQVHPRVFARARACEIAVIYHFMILRFRGAPYVYGVYVYVYDNAAIYQEHRISDGSNNPFTSDVNFSETRTRRRVSVERSFIDSPRLNSFRGSRARGKDCYSRRDETVRATVPLSPGPFLSRKLRARRIGPRPNDRTANIWQLRNMSLHLIIAVNTGGRVEWPQGVSPTRYGRGRARPLGVNSDLPPSPVLRPSFLFPSPSLCDDARYYCRRRTLPTIADHGKSPPSHAPSPARQPLVSH